MPKPVDPFRSPTAQGLGKSEIRGDLTRDYDDTDAGDGGGRTDPTRQMEEFAMRLESGELGRQEGGEGEADEGEAEGDEEPPLEASEGDEGEEEGDEGEDAEGDEDEGAEAKKKAPPEEKKLTPQEELVAELLAERRAAKAVAEAQRAAANSPRPAAAIEAAEELARFDPWSQPREWHEETARAVLGPNANLADPIQFATYRNAINHQVIQNQNQALRLRLDYQHESQAREARVGGVDSYLEPRIKVFGDVPAEIRATMREQIVGYVRDGHSVEAAADYVLKMHKPALDVIKKLSAGRRPAPPPKRSDDPNERNMRRAPAITGRGAGRHNNRRGPPEDVTSRLAAWERKHMN